MLYDLSNPLQRQNFIARCNSLQSKSCIVELREKRPVRSVSQNAYLHVCLSYFAALTGHRMEYVKQNYFKILVNPDIFIYTVDDKFRGTVRTLRSSSDINSDDMTAAIERFRNWASTEAGIYIPSPDEHALITQMEIEIERNKLHL